MPVRRGLFACYYAGMRGLHATLLDSLPHLGGQVAALYPDKEIFDVPGFPVVSGRELVDRLVAQARSAKPTIRLSEEAGPLEVGPDAVIITTVKGQRIKAGAILITAGIGRFTPCPLPALANWSGHGVDHLVAAPHEYAGREVVIVGGGDSAVDWANSLAPYARQVTLVHRRGRFRAHEHAVSQLMDSPVKLRRNSELIEFHGRGTLESVTIRDCGTSAVQRVNADVLIPALGHVANPDECIDCGACLPECPVDAIQAFKDVTDQTWVKDNADFFTLLLPGHDSPLGSPGGAYGIGTIGVDTPLVADLNKE